MFLPTYKYFNYIGLKKKKKSLNRLNVCKLFLHFGFQNCRKCFFLSDFLWFLSSLHVSSSPILVVGFHLSVCNIVPSFSRVSGFPCDMFIAIMIPNCFGSFLYSRVLLYFVEVTEPVCTTVFLKTCQDLIDTC